MMLVATGMECEPFLENKDELHTQDDCYPFIFTNIKGPILVKEEDMELISETTKMTSSAKRKNPCQENPAKDYLNYSTLIPTGWIGSVI